MEKGLSNDSLVGALPPVLTAPEVAEIFRVNPGHIYDLCRKGVISTVKLGRWIRIPKTEVVRMLSTDAIGTIVQ